MFINQEVCYICKKWFSTDDDNKKYHIFRDLCHYTGKYRGTAHNICNLRYKTPKEIRVIFHNSSTYNYYLEFEGKFEGLGKNTEKYITFSVPNEDELGNNNIKFIDSFRFISTSLSKLVNNLFEIYSKKCTYKNCKSECKFKGLKKKKLSYNCKECGRKRLKPINGLIKKFPNTYKVYLTNLFVI